MEKGVRTLQVDVGVDNYAFPSHLQPAVSAGFRNLSALCLTRISVTDQVVADFLSNCPLLEELRVRGSESLVDVRLAGPLLKLKLLEICYCTNVKSVGISAVNLVSFKYFGPKMVMPFMNAPMLSRLEIGGFYCNCLVSDLGGLLLVQPSQLERLVLDLCELNSVTPKKAMLVFARGFPEFSNLKYLELRVELEARDMYSILFLTSMMEACPCLERLRLEVTSYGMHSSFNGEYRDTLRRHRRNYLPLDESDIRLAQRKPSIADIRLIRSVDGCTVDPNFPLEGSNGGSGCGGSRREDLYKCLKAVDFGGFSGHPALLELAMYLLGNALQLESITIDPYSQLLPRVFMNFAKLEVARNRGEQLRAKLPQEAKLVIL